MDRQRIQDIAKKYKSQLYDSNGDWNGSYIGIRIDVDTFGLKVGDIVKHCSSVWVDGEETEDKLSGICAINVADADKLSVFSYGYIGNVALVLFCEDMLDIEFGEDTAEIIMSNPKVLEIIVDE